MRTLHCFYRSIALLVLGSFLSACAATMPAGPLVDAQPGRGKSPAAFDQDDRQCQMAAQNAIGGQSPGDAANQAAVGSAVVGTAAGAGLGAAIGSASGRAGAGAAIGAGTGLLAGSLIGAGNARAAGAELQYRYDSVYSRCMASRGNYIARPVAVVEPVYPIRPYPRPYWGPGYYYPY